ncbi:hypothetical protein D3C87_1583800 [compost metagenome]
MQCGFLRNQRSDVGNAENLTQRPEENKRQDQYHLLEKGVGAKSDTVKNRSHGQIGKRPETRRQRYQWLRQQDHQQGIDDTDSTEQAGGLARRHHVKP